MPANTTRLALPYPLPDDTVDPPRDIKALAEILDGSSLVAPPSVTSLPGSPVDGQECYYVADAANGVVWHLRYRAAGAKWEFVGGSALYALIGTAEVVNAPGFVDAPTPGPSIVVPLAGVYMVTFGMHGRNGTANQWVMMAYGGAGATATTADGAQADAAAANNGATVMRTNRVTLTAGTLVAKYQSSFGGSLVLNRHLSIVPVRVG